MKRGDSFKVLCKIDGEVFDKGEELECVYLSNLEFYFLSRSGGWCINSLHVIRFEIISSEKGIKFQETPESITRNIKNIAINEVLDDIKLLSGKFKTRDYFGDGGRFALKELSKELKVKLGIVEQKNRHY